MLIEIGILFLDDTPCNGAVHELNSLIFPEHFNLFGCIRSLILQRKQVIVFEQVKIHAQLVSSQLHIILRVLRQVLLLLNLREHPYLLLNYGYILIETLNLDLLHSNSLLQGFSLLPQG